MLSKKVNQNQEQSFEKTNIKSNICVRERYLRYSEHCYDTTIGSNPTADETF